MVVPALMSYPKHYPVSDTGEPIRTNPLREEKGRSVLLAFTKLGGPLLSDVFIHWVGRLGCVCIIWSWGASCLLAQGSWSKKAAINFVPTPPPWSLALGCPWFPLQPSFYVFLGSCLCGKGTIGGVGFQQSWGCSTYLYQTLGWTRGNNRWWYLLWWAIQSITL